LKRKNDAFCFILIRGPEAFDKTAPVASATFILLRYARVPRQRVIRESQNILQIADQTIHGDSLFFFVCVATNRKRQKPDSSSIGDDGNVSVVVIKLSH